MALGFIVNKKGKVSAKPPYYPTFNTGSQTPARVLPKAPSQLDIWLGRAKATATFPFATNTAQYHAVSHSQDVFYKPTVGGKDWFDTAYTKAGAYGICPRTSRVITKDGKITCEANVNKTYVLTEAEKTLAIDTAKRADDSTLKEMQSVRGLGADAIPTATPEDSYLAAQTKRFRLQEVALVGVLALAGFYVWKARK